MKTLHCESRPPSLLEPTMLGVYDRIGLGYITASTNSLSNEKGLFAWCARLLKALTGVALLPSLILAVKKTVYFY